MFVKCHLIMCTFVIQVNFILKKNLAFCDLFTGVNELLNSRHSFRVFRVFDLTIMHPGAHHFFMLVRLNPQTEFSHPQHLSSNTFPQCTHCLPLHYKSGCQCSLFQYLNYWENKIFLIHYHRFTPTLLDSVGCLTS